MTKHILLAATILIFSIVPELTHAQTSTTLSSGDVIRISVYGQPDLSTLTRVSESGEISFPLLGPITLQGLTTSESERQIADLLESRGIVRNAQVTVFVEERSERGAGYVTILGKIGRPGKYPIQSQSDPGVSSVVDLLAVAGGTSDAAADFIYLMRPGDDGYIRTKIDLVQLLQFGELSFDRPLTNGDIILVPAADVFYIYGQVRRPGRYELDREMTVMQALSVASGVTDIGNESGIILRRGNASGKTETEVEITTVLQPGDVIYVKTKRF